MAGVEHKKLKIHRGLERYPHWFWIAVIVITVLITSIILLTLPAKKISVTIEEKPLKEVYPKAIINTTVFTIYYDQGERTQLPIPSSNDCLVRIERDMPNLTSYNCTIGKINMENKRGSAECRCSYTQMV